MRIVHTSDWHLGRSLYGRRCSSEFASFLEWLAAEIEHRQVDCLLVAGDIFDSATPSNTTQSLYYSFLHRVARGCCRHVVITGGNHDSPSLLNAPRELLSNLNVTVVGCSSEDPGDEVVCLYDHQGKLEAVVCAVPFLRDRDVRSSEPGESIDDKARKLIEGIASHYSRVCSLAQARLEEHGEKAPIIAMGHLFTAGGRIGDGEEIRDLYVGTLAHVPASIFPDCIDYLALGHLHIAQRVGKRATRRYSGSPLQLSFGDDNRNKSLTLVEIGARVEVEEVEVPPFLALRTIEGDYDEILVKIDELTALDNRVLVEVRYGGSRASEIYQELQEKVADSSVEILRLVNRSVTLDSLQAQEQGETLDDLRPIDVFRRCMDGSGTPEEERNDLEHCFFEILDDLANEHDRD